MSSLSPSSSPEKKVIFYAPRDDSFKDFIKGLLFTCSMSKESVNSIISDKKCMAIFEKAFTHESVDQEQNYQFLEKIGDSTVNKIIRFYIFRKFPKLKCMEGIKYISRLETDWKSGKSLSKLAQNKGFRPFISASQEKLDNDIIPLLEDTLEAFVGAVETIVDEKYGNCIGYRAAYAFVVKLLDEIKIDYSYDALFDAKTTVNVLYNHIKSQTGIDNVKYISAPKRIDYEYHDTELRMDIGDGMGSIVWGVSIGQKHKKRDAQKLAAQMAIKNMEERGRELMRQGLTTPLTTAVELLDSLRRETLKYF